MLCTAEKSSGSSPTQVSINRIHSLPSPDAQRPANSLAAMSEVRPRIWANPAVSGRACRRRRSGPALGVHRAEQRGPRPPQPRPSAHHVSPAGVGSPEQLLGRRAPFSARPAACMQAALSWALLCADRAACAQEHHSHSKTTSSENESHHSSVRPIVLPAFARAAWPAAGVATVCGKACWLTLLTSAEPGWRRPGQRHGRRPGQRHRHRHWQQHWRRPDRPQGCDLDLFSVHPGCIQCMQAPPRLLCTHVASSGACKLHVHPSSAANAVLPQRPTPGRASLAAPATPPTRPRAPPHLVGGPFALRSLHRQLLLLQLACTPSRHLCGCCWACPQRTRARLVCQSAGAGALQPAPQSPSCLLPTQQRFKACMNIPRCHVLPAAAMVAPVDRGAWAC